jgi:putative PIN family toxin of toxin-antitoxin system
MRVVVDANVVVSALINDRGNPARVIAAWKLDRFELVSSASLLHELRVVLSRPSVRRFIAATDSEVAAFIDDIEQTAVIATPTETLTLSDDPDDNRVLEAAVAGEADYLVTGDDDLVRLREVRGTRICTPAQFLIELAGRD